MNELAIPALLPATAISGSGPKTGDPVNADDAARQFEALLLAQMLRSIRESSGGWLGSGGDSAGNAATELAEQQFARLLADQGGLGLAHLIGVGLRSNATDSRPGESK